MNFNINQNQNTLHLYSFLSRFKQLKSYKAKVMLVAFLGTHVPLLTLLASFVISHSFSWGMAIRVLVIALLATLIGTALTLLALHHLLAPVILTSHSLRSYLYQGKLPNLPTSFTDEVGTLMADTHHTISKLDEVVQYLANYDSLTSLPNQVLFREQLWQAIAQTKDHNQFLAVMFLDLNNFKDINNALGESNADLLLRAVAQRLADQLPQTAILAHLQRDIFAIAQTEIALTKSVPALAQSLLTAISDPFILNGTEIRTSGSIGIALSPYQSVDIEQLLQHASTAMEEAKRQGGGNYQFYAADMNTQLQERLALENDLSYALAREELLLHYQPRLDLTTGHIVAVEALLRWQHPTRGLVSPTKFVPIAEANGLIIEIGQWVLRTACQQNRLWQAAGLPPLRMAVNLSARQFEQPDLVQMIGQILEETELDATHLELEVTESLMMKDVDHSIKVLQELHNMGISLALDDFGTGYSSLNYLSRFPIDTLKIDRSFVQNIFSNREDAVITKAIIALAKSLHLNITAEGVETLEQFNYVEAQGCHEVQGYYFSRPIPAAALAERLDSARMLASV